MKKYTLLAGLLVAVLAFGTANVFACPLSKDGGSPSSATGDSAES